MVALGQGGLVPDPLPALLERETSLLVDRLRTFTTTRFAAAAPPFATKAAVVRHLAQQLVAAAGVRRTLPALPVAALPDMLAVVAHDLLDTEPTEPVAAGLLAEVLLHRYELDGSAPGRRASAAVLRTLEPGNEAAPDRLLAAARRRCPAYR